MTLQAVVTCTSYNHGPTTSKDMLMCCLNPLDLPEPLPQWLACTSVIRLDLQLISMCMRAHHRAEGREEQQRLLAEFAEGLQAARAQGAAECGQAMGAEAEACAARLAGDAGAAVADLEARVARLAAAAGAAGAAQREREAQHARQRRALEQQVARLQEDAAAAHAGREAYAAQFREELAAAAERHGAERARLTQAAEASREALQAHLARVCMLPLRRD